MLTDLRTSLFADYVAIAVVCHAFFSSLLWIAASFVEPKAWIVVPGFAWTAIRISESVKGSKWTLATTIGVMMSSVWICFHPFIFFPDTGLATWIQPKISCGLLLLVLVNDLSDFSSTESRSR